MNNKISKGVLDKQYATERIKKHELIFRYKVRAQLVASMAKKYLGKNNGLNILDFGAADGLTITVLNQLIPNSEITGIEYSTSLIEQAPKLPENIYLQQGDVNNLDSEFKKGQFDVVSSLAILEHLKDPIQSIREAYECLKPGGLFIATSPSPLWDDIASALCLLKEDQHEIEMTKDRMILFPRQAGFEVIKYSKFMWTPIAILPYLKFTISPSFALKVDNIVDKLKIFNWLFVNQVVIARKPFIS